MSGEDRAERGTPPDGMRARAAKAEQPRPLGGGPPPLPDAAPPASAPTPKVRKQKPPPGFISAGGVDMARGHAANIQPKPSAALTPAVPRVVLSVETDPRRVPTAPRLIAGKSESERPPPAMLEAVAVAAAATATATAATGASPSPWGTAAVEVVDKRDLPSANLPVTPAPVIAPAKPRSGGWLRYAVVLMLLLLTAGIVRRVRGMGGPDATTAPQRTIAVAPPLPPEATADPTATPTARVRTVAALAPADGDPNAAPSADPSADPTADPSAEAPPDPTALAVAPRPRLAPPPPKPTFKPLFELPQEKAKETP
jgi:hypothetical protein